MTGRLGRGITAAIAVLAIAVAACDYDKDYEGTGPGYPGQPDPQQRQSGTVFSASGDLTATLAQFRAALGDPVNRDPGDLGDGRREIGWDGVAGALLNVDTFPADFFNRVVPRGQVYRTSGRGFRVSDNALADLNPAYAEQFAAFSPTKVFIPVGSREMTVEFRVAGSDVPALVDGFGVVFSDVDRRESAVLALFDSQGRMLRKVTAPVRTDAAGFSFVGVTFPTAVVARVRIRSGETPITGLNRDLSAGGPTDLVVMDDFISGEPHPIP